jgi:hypothetical protein
MEPLNKAIKLLLLAFENFVIPKRGFIARGTCFSPLQAHSPPMRTTISTPRIAECTT